MIDRVTPTLRQDSEPDFEALGDRFNRRTEWNALPDAEKNLWRRYLKVVPGGPEGGGVYEVDTDDRPLHKLSDDQAGVVYQRWTDLKRQFGSPPGFPEGGVVLAGPAPAVGDQRNQGPVDPEIASIKTREQFRQVFPIQFPGDNGSRIRSRRLPNGRAQIARFFSKHRDTGQPKAELHRTEFTDGAKFTLHNKTANTSADFFWRSTSGVWEAQTPVTPAGALPPAPAPQPAAPAVPPDPTRPPASLPAPVAPGGRPPTPPAAPPPAPRPAVPEPVGVSEADQLRDMFGDLAADVQDSLRNAYREFDPDVVNELIRVELSAIGVPVQEIRSAVEALREIAKISRNTWPDPLERELIKRLVTTKAGFMRVPRDLFTTLHTWRRHEDASFIREYVPLVVDDSRRGRVAGFFKGEYRIDRALLARDISAALNMAPDRAAVARTLRMALSRAPRALRDQVINQIELYLRGDDTEVGTRAYRIRANIGLSQEELTRRRGT